MNALNHKKTILIGIGNDARGDDALGWLFADRLVEAPEMDVACRYQLQIEDAELISRYDTAIFVDAGVQEIENGFYFQSCEPVASVHFSTHKIDPATILWLARAIYESPVSGYVLAIQGQRWGLQQGLSAVATRNFDQALSYFRHSVLPDLAPAWSSPIVHTD